MQEEIRFTGTAMTTSEDHAEVTFWDDVEQLAEHERRAREAGDPLVRVLFQGWKQSLMEHEELLAHQQAMVGAIKDFFARPDDMPVVMQADDTPAVMDDLDPAAETQDEEPSWLIPPAPTPGSDGDAPSLRLRRQDPVWQRSAVMLMLATGLLAAAIFAWSHRGENLSPATAAASSALLAVEPASALAPTSEPAMPAVRRLPVVRPPAVTAPSAAIPQVLVVPVEPGALATPGQAPTAAPSPIQIHLGSKVAEVNNGARPVEKAVEELPVPVTPARDARRHRAASDPRWLEEGEESPLEAGA